MVLRLRLSTGRPRSAGLVGSLLIIGAEAMLRRPSGGTGQGNADGSSRRTRHTGANGPRRWTGVRRRSARRDPVAVAQGPVGSNPPASLDTVVLRLAGQPQNVPACQPAPGPLRWWASGSTASVILSAGSGLLAERQPGWSAPPMPSPTTVRLRSPEARWSALFDKSWGLSVSTMRARRTCPDWMTVCRPTRRTRAFSSVQFGPL